MIDRRRELDPAKNYLFYGDNLDILPTLASGTVDLCYIDPPFNSKRNYFQIYNNIGREDRAQAQAFEDTWEWGRESAKGLALILDIRSLQNGFLQVQTVELIRGLHKVLGEGSLLAYLVHMTLRIAEIHRILTKSGSFYLHCDPTASHYLKLICDSIFLTAGGEFLNEIVWHYRRWTGKSKKFQRLHDIVLFYAKDKDDYTFNVQYTEYTPGSTDRKMQGVLHRFKEGEEPYLVSDGSVDAKGVRDNDVWMIPFIAPSAKERLGYPTQKPEKLLEKIILASTNEGDTVLDAYCGCGTTIAVAQRLGRRWIGIDITYQSIALILKRLQDTFPGDWTKLRASIVVDGVPRDLEAATALARRQDDKTRKEFEKWVILEYTNNQAHINEKKGADGGVDGTAYFMIDADTNGKAILQAKSGTVRRSDIATLNSDRQRENAEVGILLTLQNPTRPMIKEAEKVGVYKHPNFDMEFPRIQIVTVEELLDGARIRLPSMRQDVLKSAEPATLSKDQLALDIESD